MVGREQKLLQFNPHGIQWQEVREHPDHKTPVKKMIFI